MVVLMLRAHLEQACMHLAGGVSGVSLLGQTTRFCRMGPGSGAGVHAAGRRGFRHVAVGALG